MKVVSRDSPGHDASGIRYGIHLSRQKYCELILFNVRHNMYLVLRRPTPYYIMYKLAFIVVLPVYRYVCTHSTECAR